MLPPQSVAARGSRAFRPLPQTPPPKKHTQSQEKNIKHTGNISMQDIIEIARVMRPRSVAKELAGTCKEMLGTAVSVGCTVDHMSPGEVIAKVRARACACVRAC